jgi:hypothetical protein
MKLMDEIEVQVEAEPILTSSQVNTILSIQPNSYAQIKAILLNQTSYFFCRKNANEDQRQSINLLKMFLI